MPPHVLPGLYFYNERKTDETILDKLLARCCHSWNSDSHTCYCAIANVVLRIQTIMRGVTWMRHYEDKPEKIRICLSFLQSIFAGLTQEGILAVV